ARGRPSGRRAPVRRLQRLLRPPAPHGRRGRRGRRRGLRGVRRGSAGRRGSRGRWWWSWLFLPSGGGAAGGAPADIGAPLRGASVNAADRGGGGVEHVGGAGSVAGCGRLRGLSLSAQRGGHVMARHRPIGAGHVLGSTGGGGGAVALGSIGQGVGDDRGGGGVSVHGGGFLPAGGGGAPQRGAPGRSGRRESVIHVLGGGLVDAQLDLGSGNLLVLARPCQGVERLRDDGSGGVLVGGGRPAAGVNAGDAMQCGPREVRLHVVQGVGVRDGERGCESGGGGVVGHGG